MIKLRKPFSQKIQLHIRQDMLQRLWDKYVPTSSPEYGKIELVYLKGGPGEMEKQPERIQLLLHLILKNKMLQLNLTRYPAVVKLGQKQLESSLQRMERYYTVQLKSSAPAMYRSVKQYFALLEQAGEDDRRYQGWQKTNLAIEKQKDAYRLLSLFSEKLRERLSVYSTDTLRAVEREFVHSLTETEYQMLVEELSLRKKLDLGVVDPQLVLWKESRTEMLDAIDEMESETLRQLQGQIEELTYPLMPDIPRTQDGGSHDQGGLQEPDEGSQDQEMLRTLERELIYSLSEAEYQTLSEKSIWQEKPELITYLQQCDAIQYEEIVKTLEKDEDMRQVLSLYEARPAKGKLITAVEALEQKEFCLFYHRVMRLENAAPQIVKWEENKAEMLHLIEQMELKPLQQIWGQIEHAEHQYEDDILRANEQDAQKQETLRTQEKELLHSLLETEYQTLAERLIWQEKPELIAYFRTSEKAQCKEIVRQLEKDAHMRQVLSTIQKQSAKKKLIAVAYKLEQKDFSLFYWQVAKLLRTEPQIVLWKRDKAEMLQSIDTLRLESLQKVWEQLKAVEPVQGLRHIFVEKMQYAQNQYQQMERQDLQRQIAAILEEGDLAGIADIIDLDQLMRESETEKNAGWTKDDMQEPESGFGEHRQLILQNGIYQVIQNLEHERRIRMEDIEQQQMQAANTYREIYHQMFRTKENVTRQQRNLARSAEQIFKEQHQEQLTGEEIQNIYEWSQAFLEVYLTQQGQAVTSLSIEQREQSEVISVIRQMDRYMMDQNRDGRQQEAGERLILRWQENLSKDERIQKLLIYIRELGEEQKDRLIHYLAEMVWLSAKLSLQETAREAVQSDVTTATVLPLQNGQQESQVTMLQAEDREFARKLLQIEDREFAHRLLWSEDRELAERLTQIEDRELVEQLLQIEDREFARSLSQIEDRELVERLLQVEDKEFALSLIQIGDQELARRLLQIEDREFALSLSRIENRELVRRLLQIEDREFVERLLQIEDSALARMLLRIEDQEFAGLQSENSDKQLLEVSYRSLWEWGETLLFHPEHEQEWEDADIMSDSMSDRMSYSQEKSDSDGSDGMQQADIQTQMIRRQIELAKDRNRLQSLIRQINHQADIQLVYTNAQLRLPQIQTLLQYMQQLDEKQYGVLVKELAQITKLQKRSYEGAETTDIVVPSPAEEVLSSAVKVNDVALYHRTTTIEQSPQGDAHESTRKQLWIGDKEFAQNDAHETARKQLRMLQIEDKEFIEKLLQIEDREFAERLLQVRDKELAEQLLQVEDRKFAERLLQVEDRELVGRLLQIEDREFAEKLLQLKNEKLVRELTQVEDRELAERLLQLDDEEVAERLLRLLQVEDRELAGKLLELEDKELVGRLLRIKDKEFVWKLLQDSGGQSQEVSYRDLWEWGEALLLHPEYQPGQTESEQGAFNDVPTSQQASFSTDFDDEQQTDGQPQEKHQEKHLQSLIGQINHQSDVQLTYTDAHLRMPQIQALLQYIRQLDVRQYGAFVRELAQVVTVQKLSYDEPKPASADDIEVEKTHPFKLQPFTRTFSLEQRDTSYQTLVQYIQNYERQRQATVYEKIREIGQEIFPQAHRGEERQYVDRIAGNDAWKTTIHRLIPEEIATYVENKEAYGYMPGEEDISKDKLTLYNAQDENYGLMSYEEGERDYISTTYGMAFHEAENAIHNLVPYEDVETKYAQSSPYREKHQESRYQSQELEYSVQRLSDAEDDLQRKELRMQQENAQLKSAQQQLDQKIKEVEDQLKKVENSTKAKEDVRTFAEQVKRQLYEELHVEKLRRGLV